jgi:hypothetical protein
MTLSMFGVFACPRNWPLVALVTCMEYICPICGEAFPVEVWHCACGHHSAIGEEECGNCHATYRHGTAAA